MTNDRNAEWRMRNAELPRMGAIRTSVTLAREASRNRKGEFALKAKNAITFCSMSTYPKSPIEMAGGVVERIAKRTHLTEYFANPEVCHSQPNAQSMLAQVCHCGCLLQR